jgi:hypothetical protein
LPENKKEIIFKGFRQSNELLSKPYEGAGLGLSILRILIAENDETSEMYLSTSLRMYCRDFLKAGTGAEAVEACRNNSDIAKDDIIG